MTRNRRITVVVGIVVLALLLTSLWCLRHSFQLHQQSFGMTATKKPLSSSVNTVPVPTATNKSAEATLVDKVKVYRQGLASKAEVMQQVWDDENAKPQDFYGKVIDQFGAPIVGADVAGNMAWIQGYDIGEKTKTYKTKTDANGEFEFAGVSGWKLGVVPSKPGYELNLAYNTRAINLPAGGKTSSKIRAVFNMWKLKGPEPMVHTEIDGRIPYDGRSATFDICSGKSSKVRADKNNTDKGDLRITLERNPVDIKRGDRCDWSARIEVVGGGLVEIADAYPNLAPETGYQPLLKFTGKKDDPQWNPKLTKTFYVHTQKGTFGRVGVDLIVDTARPEIGLGVGIGIEAWMNPSGSRNLEYDREKEVSP